jgi:hypothetical protein
MATLNNMINSVKENLGNRSSGVIGGTPVDTVVLAGLNKGFKNIIKVANPDYYNRIATLSLLTTTNEYAEPTTDEDGNTIRIKQIQRAQVNITGETAIYRCTQITINQFLANWRVPSSDETGVPSIYCYHNRKFLFTRYPDTTYTFRFACNIQPSDFTVSDLNITLSIDDIWVETIEAYCTHYCFSKLQLTDNASFWYSIYNESKRQNKSTIYTQPGMKQPINDYGSNSDPLTDPFTRRFN